MRRRAKTRREACPGKVLRGSASGRIFLKEFTTTVRSTREGAQIWRKCVRSRDDSHLVRLLPPQLLLSLSTVLRLCPWPRAARAQTQETFPVPSEAPAAGTRGSSFPNRKFCLTRSYGIVACGAQTLGRAPAQGARPNHCRKAIRRSKCYPADLPS